MQVKAEEALMGSIPVREGHSGGLEVVGKHERLENYLWVVSVGIGDDRKWGRGGAVSGGRASRSCDQSGGAKQVRPSALRRLRGGGPRRAAACQRRHGSGTSIETT